MRATEYPDLCIEIAGIIADVLVRNGQSHQEAERIAYETAAAVRDSMGGSVMYIPKGHHFKLSQRDLQIWGDYDGTNVNELATSYQLSNKQIYKILVRVRASESGRIQPDMFRPPEPTPAQNRPILSLKRKSPPERDQ